ncbi:response regulator, partial [Methylorubrum populi]|nr:response regulator [Methylorubrum populi]
MGGRLPSESATEPFFTTKGPGKGTGLGLSMIHGLASQSGGTMSVSSQIGQGTTVQLWLPAAGQVIDTSLRDRGEAAASDQLDRSAALRILLVDDDGLVRSGTAEMLDDLGHLVVDAETGSEALERLAACEDGFDLVITDQAMPGMSGAELIRRIKVAHPHLPVLLASGYADLTEEKQAEDWPRISKPFRQGDLASAIAGITGPPGTRRSGT